MKKAMILSIALAISCNALLAQQDQSMPTQQEALDDMFAYACQEDQLFGMTDTPLLMGELDIPKTKRSFSFKDLPVYAQLAWSYMVNEKIKPTWLACVAYIHQLRQKPHNLKK